MFVSIATEIVSVTSSPDPVTSAPAMSAITVTTLQTIIARTSAEIV